MASRNHDPTGASRAESVQESAEPVHSHKPSSAEELSQALLELGRLGSLKPVALLPHSALLNAPRVLASAGRTATDFDRAAIARDALRAALAEIVQREIREAGEIALGDHPAYKAERITHREAEYETKKQARREPGASRDTFKRRRKKAFLQIVKSLERTDPLPGSDVAEPQKDEVAPPDALRGARTLRRVVQHVGSLYYSALAYLFPRSHYLLTLNTLDQTEHMRSFALEDALSESLFVAYLNFYVFWANNRRLIVTSHNVMMAMHGEGTDRLASLLDDAHRYGPIFHGITNAHYRALEAGFRRTRPQFGTPTVQPEHIESLEHLFEQQWLPWLRADFKSDSPAGTHIPGIVGKCRDALAVLSGCAQWAEEDLAYCREEAHVAIRDFFRVAAHWRPDEASDVHLRHFVNEFFDSGGTKSIAKSP